MQQYNYDVLLLISKQGDSSEKEELLLTLQKRGGSDKGRRYCELLGRICTPPIHHVELVHDTSPSPNVFAWTTSHFSENMFQKNSPKNTTHKWYLYVQHLLWRCCGVTIIYDVESSPPHHPRKTFLMSSTHHRITHQHKISRDHLMLSNSIAAEHF